MASNQQESGQKDAIVEAQLKGEGYEHAFARVPDEFRKPLFNLTVVLTGYPVALTNFVVGAAVGVQLSFPLAMLVLLIGNTVLIGVAVLTGVMAYRTGLSTTVLSRRAFGQKGSYLYSALLVISAITWVAMNGDIFARTFMANFSWWPLPTSLTAALAILMWIQSAVRGFKGLQVVSFLGVPSALIMGIIGVIAVFNSPSGIAGVINYIPETKMTLSAATASVVGGWIFGASITPDVCRYAKSEGDAIFAAFFAFFLGCFGLQLAGVIVGMSTGTGDFVKVMVSLGLTALALVLAFFCIWCTQDNNIYSAGLAAQNIIKDTRWGGKIPHGRLCLALGLVSAVLAGFGIYSKIVPVIQFLSILMPPMPGVLIAQEYFIKKPKDQLISNKYALISWLSGGILAYISLKTNFFVPPVIGIVSAGLIHYILEKFTAKPAESGPAGAR
ncbi:MAG: cytosine permease [Peptococcaceae bacterium]|nr:cytosine permease [Peptococcaceae bacterium]